MKNKRDRYMLGVIGAVKIWESALGEAKGLYMLVIWSSFLTIVLGTLMMVWLHEDAGFWSISMVAWICYVTGCVFAIFALFIVCIVRNTNIEILDLALRDRMVESQALCDRNKDATTGAIGFLAIGMSLVMISVWINM